MSREIVIRIELPDGVATPEVDYAESPRTVDLGPTATPADAERARKALERPETPAQQAESTSLPPWPSGAVPDAPAESKQPPGDPPVCRIHRLNMEWKGGRIGKSGKRMPLWGCPDRSCREAIWP